MSRSYKLLLSTAADASFVPTADDPFFVWPVADLTTKEKEKEQAEHKIKAGEAHQRKNGVAVAHHFAVAVARVKKAVDQPWLTSQFGRHPAQSVSNVRKGKCQHQHPEQPGAGF